MYQPHEGGVGSADIFSFVIYLHVPNHKPEEEGRPFSSLLQIWYIITYAGVGIPAIMMYLVIRTRELVEK